MPLPLHPLGDSVVNCGTFELGTRRQGMTFSLILCGEIDKLVDLATEDQAEGHALSAGAKLKRAAIYYTVAERMQGQGHEGREATYALALDTFARGTKLFGDP